MGTRKIGINLTHLRVTGHYHFKYPKFRIDMDETRSLMCHYYWEAVMTSHFTEAMTSALISHWNKTGSLHPIINLTEGRSSIQVVTTKTFYHLISFISSPSPVASSPPFIPSPTAKECPWKIIRTVTQKRIALTSVLGWVHAKAFWHVLNHHHHHHHIISSSSSSSSSSLCARTVADIGDHGLPILSVVSSPDVLIVGRFISCYEVI